jgi:hypothetical protein
MPKFARFVALPVGEKSGIVEDAPLFVHDGSSLTDAKSHKRFVEMAREAA